MNELKSEPNGVRDITIHLNPKALLTKAISEDQQRELAFIDIRPERIIIPTRTNLDPKYTLCFENFAMAFRYRIETIGGEVPREPRPTDNTYAVLGGQDAAPNDDRR